MAGSTRQELVISASKADPRKPRSYADRLPRMSGGLDSANGGWLALTFWALLRWKRQPDTRRAITLGVVAGLLPAWGPNLAIVAVCTLAIPTLVMARARWKSAAIAAAVAVALALPPLLTLVWVEGNSVGRFEQAKAPVTTMISIQPEAAAGPSRWLQVSVLHNERSSGAWWQHPDVVPKPLSTDVFLTRYSPGGRRFLSLVAVAACLLGAWRRRPIWPWLLGAIALKLMSLGPGPPTALSLPLSPDSVLSIRSPPLLALLPYVDRFNNFALFGQASGLLLGVATALSLAAVPRAWRRVVLGLLLAELLLATPVRLPLGTTDQRVSPNQVDALRGEGAILVLPLCAEVEYLLQTYHHRPIISLWNRPVPSAGTADFVLELQTTECGRPNTTPALAGVTSIAILPLHYREAVLDRVRCNLDQRGWTPDFRSEGLEVWEP